MRVRLHQDARPRQRLRRARRARTQRRRSTDGLGARARRPPHRHRLRPADRARALRRRRFPHAHLQLRRRRGRGVRQRHPRVSRCSTASPRGSRPPAASLAASRPATAACRSTWASRASSGTRSRCAYAMDTLDMPVAWDELERPCAVNVGNPHVVFFVRDCDAVAAERLGPAIETRPAVSRAASTSTSRRWTNRGDNSPARVGARRRADPGLRHRRLRHRGRRDAPQAGRARRSTVTLARRHAADRLGRGRPYHA